MQYLTSVYVDVCMYVNLYIYKKHSTCGVRCTYKTGSSLNLCLFVNMYMCECVIILLYFCYKNLFLLYLSFFVCCYPPAIVQWCYWKEEHFKEYCIHKYAFMWKIYECINTYVCCWKEIWLVSFFITVI